MSRISRLRNYDPAWRIVNIYSLIRFLYIQFGSQEIGCDVPADLPGPGEVESQPSGLAFPGADWRPVPGDRIVDGVPVLYAWHRFDQAVSTPAANQAVLSWSTCGNIIGLAVTRHRDAVDISQAHRTLNTGVIGHTIHFAEPFDVSQWLLLAHWADKAMAKTSDRELDWQHAM